MSKNSQKEIQVYAHWQGLDKPVLMGFLHAESLRGKEIFSFEYEKNWLANNNTFLLDPELSFFSGKQYASSGKNFGMFLDSSPDRWGRMLMDRRESQTAREEDRKERKLLESDYLLGVFDECRSGGLRFRINPNGCFLEGNNNFASPPWVALRELEHASLEIENEDAEKKPNYSKWLQLLFAPGGSLGGARPKASIIDPKKHLWIAKFPSVNDKYDIAAWEMVVNKLAENAGINVAVSKIQKFGSKYHTFLTKRFDRSVNHERIHFSSAMTMLRRTDGDDAASGASYLELAGFILQQGAQPDRDLEELWRRIVFNICVSNVDDHLRNHGFLLEKDGWTLSPAFDMNPVANGNGLRLNISESDNDQDLNLALSVAKDFRIKLDDANRIISEVIKSVKKWHKVAVTLGISQRQQQYMENAFRVAEGFYDNQ